MSLPLPSAFCLAQNFLFVHAHPDDETLITGGTIARLIEEDKRVGLITATRGERGEIRLQTPVKSRLNPGQIRRQERQLALAALGLEESVFLGSGWARALEENVYEDSGMVWLESGLAGPGSQEPGLLVTKRSWARADLWAGIKTFQPDLLITYNEQGGYGHPDHRLLHEISREILEHRELKRVGMWVADPDPLGGPTGKPGETIEVDCSQVMAKKIAALKNYPSQLVVHTNGFELSGGQKYPLSSLESYRRI